ncbi:MAG: HAD family hydrolase [Oligoflexia bacterium]|nr:HAD family hydrolase [Oligoflexia bacterium]
MNRRIGFLIDMDGVIYRGNELIDGSVKFINLLEQRQIPFTFLTNNSQRTQKDIIVKLNRWGLKINEDNVYTSALATARFLSQQKPNGTAFIVGEGGLFNALNDVGYAIVDKNPDFVVIGEGRLLNLEIMELAVRLVSKGARLIATNLDANCPTAEGEIRPGCGAFVKLIEEATGKKAFSVGKPCPIIFRSARKRLNLGTDDTIVIGDTMETDILGAVSLGLTSILTLTGSTKRNDLINYPYRPDIIIESIKEMPDILDSHILTANLNHSDFKDSDFRNYKFIET